MNAKEMQIERDKKVAECLELLKLIAEKVGIDLKKETKKED